jgi:hypothetical protein
MTKDEASLIAGATLNDAWPIVEAFSKIKREHPDDGNRAISLIVERLRAHGLPVIVHEPMLYLTLPKGAHVAVDGRKLHARPAPMTLSVPTSQSRSARRRDTARKARSCLGRTTTRRPECPT